MKKLARLSQRVPWSPIKWQQTWKPLPWWLCWYIELLWEPRDLWIGVFWKKPEKHEWDIELFLCLLPCLPIRIHVWDDSDIPF